MSTYAEVARILPTPEQEQTRAFAEYVTGAHSWYKHLPIHSPSPFVFYLDPNAGRAMVHVSDSEVAFVDHTDESEKFHYTWQTTESYRRRFGLWNYEAPYGRSIRYESSEDIVDTAGSGLTILSPTGEWLPIPELLTRAGTAPLSALMWYPHWRPVPLGLDLWEQEMRIACILHVRSPVGQSISDVESVKRLKLLMRVLPHDMNDALRPLMALWEDQTYQLESVETFRAYHEYREAERAKGRYGEASATDPGFILYTQADEKWETTPSRARERTLLETLIAALERERQRQIDAMITAMNRFVEMLHAVDNIEGRLH